MSFLNALKMLFRCEKSVHMLSYMFCLHFAKLSQLSHDCVRRGCVDPSYLSSENVYFGYKTTTDSTPIYYWSKSNPLIKDPGKNFSNSPLTTLIVHCIELLIGFHSYVEVDSHIAFMLHTNIHNLGTGHGIFQHI